MQQYFINQKINSDDSNIYIDDRELHNHLIKVLRMKIGDNCILVDLLQNTYIATLKSYDKILNFDILIDKNTINTEFKFKPIIACSLSKKDKIEWIAQKSTELGAKEIIFFSSKFSIMKWNSKNQEKKLNRLNEIVKNAAQQSHRKLIPKVRYVNSLEELIEDFSEVDHKLVAYEEVAKTGEPSNLEQQLKKMDKKQSIICLFGPEGGFDPDEIQMLLKNDYLKIGLGPRILRAETAPIYFLSALSYKFDLM
ncbi:16S rRNA (uracil(1498)-N(3))-methyltransferase [Companilactobacillus sp. DQM5]|uniref:16S rRNA (uracil(1498)-N(3))-methyltransferase n=1 Tax=Companilactobacillus sp. DQM5 TaxID=3463359 RepID=UPI004059792E